MTTCRKTTTICCKMYGMERVWEQTAPESSSRPRQLFVTKSKMLAKKVEQEFLSLLSKDALLPHAPEHFINRVVRYQAQSKRSIFSSDDTGLWRNDLPRKFSELQDIHFPLFISFDDVCSSWQSPAPSIESPVALHHASERLRGE